MDGDEVFILTRWYQRPVDILSVTRDITERKQAEEKLRQTLESLRKAFYTTVQVMVSAMETRDPCTAMTMTLQKLV